MNVKIYIIGLILFYTLDVSAQVKRGHLVVSPQVFLTKGMIQSKETHNSQHFGIGSSVYYYFNDKIAVGVLLRGDYRNLSPQTVNYFARRSFEIAVMPEVQYDFLKSPFTPFLKIRASSIGFNWQYVENPAIPERLRKNGNFIINGPFYEYGMSCGISYHYKSRSNVFAMVNAHPIRNFTTSNLSVSIGCQIILSAIK